MAIIILKEGAIDDIFVKYGDMDDYIGHDLWMWGANSFGQLGDGSTNSRPMHNAEGLNWKQVSCGLGENGGTTPAMAGIKSDGTLWTCGNNNEGQLGDGSTTDRSRVVQISSSITWRYVSVGGDHTFAIKTDGSLFGWGNNPSGNLGDGTRTSRSSPVQTIASGTNWKQVSCGNRYTAAIKTDGTLWTWGGNASGQLGDGTIASKSSPVQTAAGGTNWKQVSCGDGHTAAIKTDGTLWLWGNNSSGELGDGTRASKSSPVQTVAGGYYWKQVSCGNDHTAAIKTDGTLWTWGDNASGQLGNGTVANKSSPVQTIAGGTNWKQVSTGNASTAAIKTDGTLWTWGKHTELQTSVPTQRGNTSDWKQVSVGEFFGGAVKYFEE